MQSHSTRALLLSTALICACSPTRSDDAVVAPQPTPPAEIGLTQADTCDALRATFLDSVTEAVLNARYGGIRVDDKLGGKGDDTQVPDLETVELESEPPPVEAEDLVKVVGPNLFVVSDDQLRIVAIDDTGQLTATGYFGVGADLTAVGMFADDRVAVLFHAIAEDHDAASFVGTRVTMLNVADPTQPELLTQFDVEGEFEIARREGDFINVATSSRLRVDDEIWDIAYGESATLPATEPNGGDERQTELRDAARAQVREGVDALLADAPSMLPRFQVDGTEPTALLECDAIWATTPAASVRLTTLTRVAADGGVASFAIIGDDFAGAVSGGAMFASFSDRWGPFAGSSRLHVFEWTSGYVATTEIPGRLIDEFSIEAHDDLVSVITLDEGASLHAFRRDGVQLEPSEPTAMTTSDLVVANRITSSAAFVATHGDSERIYAVRNGNTEVSGPFEVGGVPTMIHALTDERFLVVAQEVDSEEKQIGVRVELFESDAEPVATTSVSTGDFAAWSEAMWEPRSLAYSPAGLVAFPVNIEAWAEANDANFSGVLVYDTTDGIVRRGAIDHGDLQSVSWCRSNDQPDDCEAPPTTPWWTHVRRSVFVGETLVTISDTGAKAHSTSDFSELSALPFD